MTKEAYNEFINEVNKDDNGYDRLGYTLVEEYKSSTEPITSVGIDFIEWLERTPVEVAEEAVRAIMGKDLSEIMQAYDEQRSN